MDFALYFLIGVAFGVIVVPAFRLFMIKRAEINLYMRSGADIAAKQEATDKLVAHIKGLKAEEVKMVAIVVENYDEAKNFCGFGGAATDIAKGIKIMAMQLESRVPGLFVPED